MSQLKRKEAEVEQPYLEELVLWLTRNELPSLALDVLHTRPMHATSENEDDEQPV